MSWTKRQFITEAFAELGLADYEFDLGPEALQTGLRRLDAMMAEWAGKNIYVGYPYPDNPEDSDLDTETNAPDYAIEAILYNLAVRLGASFRKPVFRETKVMARQAFTTLLSRQTRPVEMQFSNKVPKGAGNKPWRYDDNPFMSDPIPSETDPLSPNMLNLED